MTFYAIKSAIFNWVNRRILNRPFQIVALFSSMINPRVTLQMALRPQESQAILHPKSHRLISATAAVVVMTIPAIVLPSLFNNPPQPMRTSALMGRQYVDEVLNSPNPICWNICGEVSAQVLLVLFCVWKWEVPRAHSREVFHTAERVENGELPLLLEIQEVTQKFRYCSFKMYIRVSLNFCFEEFWRFSAEYWGL